MCELSGIPVRFIDAPTEPEAVLDYIRTTFTVHRDSAMASINGFAVIGRRHECRLSPEPTDECLLRIEVSEGGLTPVKSDTTIRFFIDAYPFFDFRQLPDICILDGTLTAAGQWEWTISCDGAPNCSNCSIELHFDEAPEAELRTV